MAPLLVILVSVMSWGLGLAAIPKSPMNDEYCIRLFRLPHAISGWLAMGPFCSRKGWEYSHM